MRGGGRSGAPGAARRSVAMAWLAAGCALAHPAQAQLRPLDPVAWTVFERDATWEAEVGGSFLHGQRASLAGTQGDLWEAGTFRLAWRTGRVSLEAGGTPQRFFRERERFAEPDPLGDVALAEGGRRHDSGDYRIQTVVRLTPAARGPLAVLRFGTRLPTTDNMTGLDRDATDFFFTLAGRARGGRLAANAEAGLGIFGTRRPRFEQDDVLLYAAGAGWSAGPLVATAAAVGQKHGSGHGQIRGNEDLGELRVGFRTAGRRWIRVEAVHGYERISPRTGVIAAAGVSR
jgi:hypothetical protein